MFLLGNHRLKLRERFRHWNDIEAGEEWPLVCICNSAHETLEMARRNDTAQLVWECGLFRCVCAVRGAC